MNAGVLRFIAGTYLLLCREPAVGNPISPDERPEKEVAIPAPQPCRGRQEVKSAKRIIDKGARLKLANPNFRRISQWKTTVF